METLRTTPSEDIRERLFPVIVFAGRTALGVCLAVVAGMIGIGTAWSLFIFSGAQSLDAWLSSLMAGAGIGAGVAAFGPWVRIDRETKTMLAAGVAIGVGAGVLGAITGYRFGSTQEVECCAMPTITPVYYTAIGAALLANAAVIVFALIRDYITKKSRTKKSRDRSQNPIL